MARYRTLSTTTVIYDTATWDKVGEVQVAFDGRVFARDARDNYLNADEDGRIAFPDKKAARRAVIEAYEQKGAGK